MFSLKDLSFKTKPQMQTCYDDIDKFIDLAMSDIYYSYKIDGLRCWVVISKETKIDKESFRKIGSIKYYNKTGKELENFAVFNNSIIDLCSSLNKLNINYPIILDTIISTKDKNINKTLEQLNKTNNLNPYQFQMNIFDLVLPDKSLKERNEILKSSLDLININQDNINHLEYKLIPNFTITKLKKLVNDSIQDGYDGIILSTGDSFYSFGRKTRSCCIVKKVNTVELEIINVNENNGKVTSLVCNYKGNIITITNRLSDRQRKDFAVNKPIGKIAEISYSEKGINNTLKNPLFVRLKEIENLNESDELLEENSKIDLTDQFIIHTHDALRAGLHHDLRLYMNNTLKSFATKRLRELIYNRTNKIILFKQPDHDPSWFDFEGDIDDGFGKGKVKIWDKGKYNIVNEDEDGKLTIEFYGNKLKGKFSIIPYHENEYLFVRNKNL